MYIMINNLKITLFIIVFIFFGIGKTFAETYSESGYITVVRATNTSGTYCYLMLSKQERGEDYQVGYWNCNTYYGGGLFEIARNAKIQGTEVFVTFDKNEIGSKWVYSIRLKFSSLEENNL